MKNTYKCICNKCGKEYYVTCTKIQFEKGRYRKTCSSGCANSRKMTEEKRERIRNSVKNTFDKKRKERKYTYICEKCGNSFISYFKIRKERKKHCDNCKQKYPHYHDDPKTILDLSKRTITKILCRANIGCSICGWNKSTCDIHHIIPRKNNGSDEISNLIIVCPNCHRIIHNSNVYSEEYLKELSIDKTFNNWKDFYHIKN